MNEMLVVLMLMIILANFVIAQDLNPYHYMIKGLVKQNFKMVQEHRYDAVLKGISVVHVVIKKA